METKTNSCSESGWEYSEAVFWMEENPPSGPTWAYAMDFVPQQTADLLILMSKLGILDFGCFYETVDMVRLKP